MSFWILTYIDRNESCYTEPMGLYKTEDEAINEAIIESCGDELYETPDGKIWFHSDEFIGLPIELKDLRKRVKKNGFLDKANSWNDAFGDCEQYYIITEMKVTGNSEVVAQKAKLLTEEGKCLDCEKNFEIHRFGGPTIAELSPGCPRCRDCSPTGALYYEYRDKWYCSETCKESKHKQLSSEGQNKELRQPGKNFHGPPGSKKPTILTVKPYPNPSNEKRKVYRSEDGIIVIRKNGNIIAIGLDIENDGSLKMISIEKHSSVLEDLIIDEDWRKGNEEAILFSDYLKMTYRVKN